MPMYMYILLLATWTLVATLVLISENTAIAISTYNMVAYTQKRAADSQEV